MGEESQCPWGERFMGRYVVGCDVQRASCTLLCGNTGRACMQLRGYILKTFSVIPRAGTEGHMYRCLLKSLCSSFNYGWCELRFLISSFTVIKYAYDLLSIWISLPLIFNRPLRFLCLSSKPFELPTLFQMRFIRLLYTFEILRELFYLHWNLAGENLLYN